MLEKQQQPEMYCDVQHITR